MGMKEGNWLRYWTASRRLHTLLRRNAGDEDGGRGGCRDARLGRMHQELSHGDAVHASTVRNHVSIALQDHTV
jgi:hypothetical protein